MLPKYDYQVDINTPPKPLLFMLVGLPGCGKSTWVSEYNTIVPPERYGPEHSAAVVSSDNIVETIAKSLNLTYNDCWPDTHVFAEKLVYRRIQSLGRSRYDVIIDETNLTVKSREWKLKAFPDHERIGIYFPTPDTVTWWARLGCRTGKVIPKEDLERMEAELVVPRKDEGFDFVYRWT